MKAWLGSASSAATTWPKRLGLAGGLVQTPYRGDGWVAVKEPDSLLVVSIGDYYNTDCSSRRSTPNDRAHIGSFIRGSVAGETTEATIALRNLKLRS